MYFIYSKRAVIYGIVKILLKKTGQKYEPFGSTTFKKENTAGVEPDVCFYIQNYQMMLNKRRLEPNDPPPDLAIEIDVTSQTTLEAYLALGVPELWIYHHDKLIINLLQNGNYIQSDFSLIFPNIPLTKIIPATIAKSWRLGTWQALAEFEQEINF
ncbi:MAG TPA: Uma2 family endonuclease [Nostocaceae cyanobacterium]|nr:Uma2 family endonuclease [Nostocaceae cyanobacterium]